MPDDMGIQLVPDIKTEEPQTDLGGFDLDIEGDPAVAMARFEFELEIAAAFMRIDAGVRSLRSGSSDPFSDSF
jgi:hypothetical protein